ncbi:CPBP family intramembrane glutamic endopeptidase [Agromyces soli]|uniref:CPBP family intramembrane metalloprotease n=1 Tax=Agromyces soli TaxID=659012 RepID=A0ABY4AX81_9MICO|nr:CPBP family intramembrane glutamic endopeptidase [Agromyces soli]UOE26716.1 CPBP family intramembrane metalloprotease [Agromyces soli]
MTDAPLARDSAAAPAAPERGWRAFWNRGGWWKALIVVVVYLGVYQLLPILLLPLTRPMMDENMFATPGSVFAGLALPVILGSIVLLAFAWSLGWLPRPLFGRQPVRGRWWMWFAPVLVLIPIALRLFGIDYGAYTGGVIVMTFVAGLFIGLSEELVTRGLVVTLMRKAGHGEWAVAAVSALFFALMHSVNALTGQAITTVGFTLLYTFAFGILMYLVMRVTGSIVWAMVLHGLTDPTTFLATGGVDKTGGAAAESPLLALAGPATILLIVGALLLLIFIRGRATPLAATVAGAAAAAPRG